MRCEWGETAYRLVMGNWSHNQEWDEVIRWLVRWQSLAYESSINQWLHDESCRPSIHDICLAIATAVPISSKFPWANSNCNMVQNSHETSRKYWATPLSVRSFAGTAHSFAGSALFASLMRFATLIDSLIHWLSCSWGSIWFDVSKWFRSIVDCTVGQNSQKLGCKYWTTRSSVRQFARTALSFACSTQLASFARSAALTRMLTRSLPRIIDVSKWPDLPHRLSVSRFQVTFVLLIRRTKRSKFSAANRSLENIHHDQLSFDGIVVILL